MANQLLDNYFSDLTGQTNSEQTNVLVTLSMVKLLSV